MAAKGSERSDVVRNRGKILASAAHVLGDNPNASMSEIAAHSGLSRATLYRHFSSVDDLLFATREHVLTLLESATERVAEKAASPTQVVEELAQELMLIAKKYRGLLTTTAEIDPKFARRRERLLETLEDRILEGQTSGEIRDDVTPRWIMTCLLGLLESSLSVGLKASAATAALASETLLGGINHRG
ncbi:TetR/AcrR family transcriptional regulator [Micrococcoides hystricis]|uniref:TetR/AcrR family transcriptional regulator n=1 Tax=Micrococcoides hystricis TaxID=1572761 RepID=A0ABV6PCL9_9MICC